MEKSWIKSTSRFKSAEFAEGLEQFLRLARDHVDEANRIRCPCQKCCNRYYKGIDIVENHIWVNGFDQSYTEWIFHGEKEILGGPGVHDYDDSSYMLEDVDEMQPLLNDVFMGTFAETNVDQPSTSSTPHAQPNSAPTSFLGLLEDAQRPLYPICTKFSKLSFIIKLLHIKTLNNMSIKAFDMTLNLLNAAFEEVGVELPKSHYEAKQLHRGLGFSYEKIHACKNDCILFWKEHANREECPVCGESRWTFDNGRKKNSPCKVLRYFPLKPRLQRLFMSKPTALDMRWHLEGRSSDPNTLRHPVDSQAWKEFDKNHPWFAQEPRNVRLGLASDGFNPFANMSTTYSVWPVVMIPYNLPPWKCTKDPFLMMSLLIPGPKAPGNELDVYLRPLVDELNELWSEGVDTYDAHTSQHFQLYAALLWTINDFPAYGNLSGWSTKGKLACPTCNGNPSSVWLKHSRKTCYMGHRRFLPLGHSWRRKKSAFDGTEEHRGAPAELVGTDVLEQLMNVRDVPFGKSPKFKKHKRTPDELNWSKKSIFFELPYWSTLRLRHCLDVMHIEKNICDSILGTLMGIEGKTKDTIASRNDLCKMGIRPDLHIQRSGCKGLMPVACYTLSKNDRKLFCQWLKGVKFPDGFASNISRCVNVAECKISGMKSHDCHVLIQRVLPVGIRGYMRKDITDVLTDLSQFFKELCSRTVKVDDVTRLQSDIVTILCRLEMIFPPSFFDVMVHLAVHLPCEVLLGGPVQFRWMYPIERTLGHLKRFVRNRSRPEGSIAEAYISFECLNFCSTYLQDIKTRFNRTERNTEVTTDNVEGKISVFSQNVHPLGAGTPLRLSPELFTKAQWYILNNCEEVGPYLREHRELLKGSTCTNVGVSHEAKFPSWFKNHIKMSHSQAISEVTQQMYALACGADPCAYSYAGCITNGVRFITRRSEEHRRTQNSGLVVEGWHDSNLVDFYGQLTSILELHYIGGNRVYLFECEWWDIGDKKRGIRTDRHFTYVNTSRSWYTDDPFILATQAKQVFYLDDPKERANWRVVQKFIPRNVYDVSMLSAVPVDSAIGEAYQEEEPGHHFPFMGGDVDESLNPLHRDDLTLELVDVSAIAEGDADGDEIEFAYDSTTDESEFSSTAFSDDEPPDMPSSGELDSDLDV